MKEQGGYADILKSIDNKQVSPVYILHGEEPYFIDLISEKIENGVLTESQKGFNLRVMYGKDVQIGHIIDAAMQYPVMSPHQVIIIKEAQDLKDISSLESYLQKPVPSTVLVLCYKHKKLAKRTFKKVSDQVVDFESVPVKDWQLAAWIGNYVKSKGLHIDQEALELLAEHIGNDLSRIVNEIEKLELVIESGKKITKDLIFDYIGISKEYNVFELQKALSKRNESQVYKIMHHLSDQMKKNPLIYIISMLYNHFSKIYFVQVYRGESDETVNKALGLGYFLRDYKEAAAKYNPREVEQIIHVLKVYDLKAKGVDSYSLDSETGLYREMMFKIMNPQASMV